MAQRRTGIVVVGDAATVVDTLVPKDAKLPIEIIADQTWRLQQGDRAAAYAVLHQLCADHLRENKVAMVVLKSSAVASGSASLALLKSAEVRGIVTAAAASVCTVNVVAKSAISRNYGDRKVDEYLQDDDFWAEHTIGGKLRKTSREAVMLLIASR